MPGGSPCKYAVSKCNKDIGAVNCVACMHMPSFQKIDVLMCMNMSSVI